MTKDPLKGESLGSPHQHLQQQGPSHIPRILLNSNSNSTTNTPLRIETPPMPKSPPTVLQEKLQADMDLVYKHIRITREDESDISNWDQLVSFDTISGRDLDSTTDQPISSTLPGIVRTGRTPQRNIHNDPEDNEIYPGELPPSASGRLRARSPLPFRSPSPSGQYLLRKLNQLDQLDNARVNEDGYRTDYPSGGPMVDTASVTIKASQRALSASKPGSRWLVYITGRRHTWVALDFTISKLLKPGDTIIVISRIPLSRWKNPKKTDSKTQGNINSNPIANSAKRVELYVQELLDPSLDIHLIVDIYLTDSFEELISSCMSLYNPHGLVISHKPSAKFLSSINWLTTSRLSHRLIKNYPLPLVIVPVLTSNKFEVEYFDELAKKKNWNVNVKELKETLERLDQAKSPLPDAQLDKLLQKRLKELAKQRTKERTPSLHYSPDSDASSKDSEGGDDDSVMSDSSSDDDDDDDDDDEIVKGDAYLKVTEVVKRKREELRAHFESASKQPITPDWFLNNITKVSDLTARVAYQMEQASRDSAAADLVRSLTGMPQLEKQKSMLDVLDNDEDSNLSAVDGLRKQLTGACGSTSPHSPSIKFQLDHNLRSKSIYGSSTSSLRKTRSNVIEGGQRAASSLSFQHNNGLIPSKSYDVGMSKSPTMLRAKSESTLSTTTGRKPKKGGFLARLMGGKRS